MIDDGILFSYKNAEEYAASVQRVRDRICERQHHYYTLRDRATGNKRRFAIAIFDETGAAEIDVCLLGNTAYILAMRMAEQKWFPSAHQPEFDGCGSSIFATLPFEAGYGELGILKAVGLPRFTIDQASTHCRAMKEYMLAWASGPISAPQTEACKLAFAYFAMTIAEAARFRSVETMMYHGGIDPVGVIPVLQTWVINSSVRDARFPASIAIAGVHEKRKSDIWKGVYKNLTDNPDLAPTAEELAGDSPGVQDFFAQAGVFDSVHKVKEGQKSGRDSGMEFLLDAFFRSRHDPALIGKARRKFDDLRKAGKKLTYLSMAGLTL
jgi:hypothetical protein